MLRFKDNELKDYYTSTLIIFILGLASYAFFAFQLTIVGDDWSVLVFKDHLYKYTFKIGRWAHGLLTNLFNMRQFAPPFTFFFLLSSISISSAFILKIFNFKHISEKLLFSALFVSFPIWYEVFIFNTGRIPKGFGLLTSVISAYILIQLYNKNKNSFAFYLMLLASILLGAFSIGCYQIYILFAVFIINCHFLINIKNWSSKELVSNIVKVICWLFGVVVSYYLITKIFTILYEVRVTPDDRYSIMVIPENIDTKLILKNFSLIVKYYTSGQLLIPLWIKLMSLFSTAFFFLYFIKSTYFNNNKSSLFKVTIGIIGLLLLLIGPWILGFIRDGNNFRYNSLSHLSISFAFFLVFVLTKLSNKNLRLVYILTLISMIIWMSFTNSAAAFGKYLENKRDFALTEKLLFYIHQSPNYTGNPNKGYNVYFVGKNPYPLNEIPFDMSNDYDLNITNLINSGVWDVQIQRIKAIFKILGEPGLNYNIHPNASKKSKTITKSYLMKNMIGEFKNIKNWPHKNSLVSLKNGKDFVVIFNKNAIK